MVNNKSEKKSSSTMQNRQNDRKYSGLRISESLDKWISRLSESELLAPKPINNLLQKIIMD